LTANFLCETQSYWKLSKPRRRIEAFRVESLGEVIPIMRKAQQQSGPSLIEFVVEQHDMVYPMVPAGADLHEMIERPPNKINDTVDMSNKESNK